MVKSMTGYGRSEALLENGKLTIEIRSLNGRNADISIKSQLIPKDRDLYVRKKMADKLQRGTIDMFITWEANSSEVSRQINAGLVNGYWEQIRGIRNNLNASGPEGCSDELLSTILRMPDVIDSPRGEIITDENWPLVDRAIDEALDNIDAFRIREGAVLKADVCAKVESILECSRAIESLEAERTEAMRAKILARFNELKLDPDPARLEQEMIFYIEKLDINEERVRLRQHCAYCLETLETPESGRKLGFIAQEMGREINTTGSKANHSGIQKYVTMMKDELEKIKEQSLNIL